MTRVCFCTHCASICVVVVCQYIPSGEDLQVGFSKDNAANTIGKIMEAYMDCRAGVSGDMTLAALCSLGLDLGELQALLHRVGIECTLRQWQECRAAGPGGRVDVSWPAAQPLRHPADMADIIRKVAVSDAVRCKALAALEALTAAEAHAHQIPPEDVHFHEVGAIDTLVDILGAAWGLEKMGITRVVASPLPWFSGTVECAHGILPLPAPATARLMQGKPVFDSGATTELVTPTGAALVHALVEDFCSGPQGVLCGMGTGYGSRPSASGLRLWLVEAAGECAEAPDHESVALLESHIDHLTGEELGAALEELSALPQVLDVLWLPGLGKKNRPAGALRVLCLPQHATAVQQAFFRHTHTLGLRIQVMDRAVLPREAVQTACSLSKETQTSLPAKKYRLEGADYVRTESDALREAARQQGLGMVALRLR